jgi:hypothetical protein
MKSEGMSPAQFQTLCFILTLHWRCPHCRYCNHPLHTRCDTCGEPKMEFSKVSAQKANNPK